MRKTAQIEKSGRIVIPSEMRARLDLSPGDSVVIELDEETHNEIRVFTAKQGLKRAQDLVQQYAKPSKVSPVDELISDRKAAAKHGK